MLCIGGMRHSSAISTPRSATIWNYAKFKTHFKTKLIKNVNLQVTKHRRDPIKDCRPGQIIVTANEGPGNRRKDAIDYRCEFFD